VRPGSWRAAVAVLVAGQALGGACGKIVGIHDTVNDGAGGKVVASGSGGVPAGNGGGKQGTASGGRAGGAGGGASPGGTGGVSGAAGVAGAAATPGGSGTGGMLVAPTGGTTGMDGGKAGGGGTIATTGSGGAVGGRGVVGSGGVSTGGVVGAGGVASGGSVGAGGVVGPGSGGNGGGNAGSGGVTPDCQGSATRCSGAQVQMCVGGQFSTAMDCPAHQTCAGMACACADPVCRAVGPVCASSSSLGMCAQEAGCFYQPMAAAACPGGTVCERIAPASCADPTWAQWPLPPSSPSAYTDNQDGTVTDNVTGLMWQSPPAPTPMSQSAALTYCSTQLKAGGHSDWRLPTKIELASLVDSGRASVPTIDNVFSTTVADFYWTSTIYAQATANGWFVNFQTGGVGFYDLTGVGNVRCVR